MNGNTKMVCQGYCGGMVKIKNLRRVEGGESFCPDCYKKAQESKKMRNYDEGDY